MSSMRAKRAAAPAVVAALEHLTGPARGETAWLVEDATDVRLGANRRLTLESGDNEDAGPVVARLTHEGGGYAVAAVGGHSIWVDGVAIGPEAHALVDGDVIEFCEDGPISRISFYRQGAKSRHSVGDILGDGWTYLKYSRRGPVRRVLRMVGTVARRLAFETPLGFRALVLAALAVLVVLVYRGQQERSELRLALQTSTERLEAFSAALARAREDALTPADLAALRDEIGSRLVSAAGRIDALEARSQASRTVIARAFASVAFVQGAYGFREAASGRLLRHGVGPDGRPLVSPGGQPLLTLEGDGPVAERQFTGTGFALAAPAAFVTNRHVALPWEKDASAATLADQGFEPVMVRLIAYFPGKQTPIELKLLRASETNDLALLAAADAAAEARLTAAGLALGAAPPEPGAEVIVMGYPTGLRALLAQSGDAFVAELQADKATGFWDVAARLAAAGHVAPLASRGIVASATAATVVYDAETTHGGSGGPVLNVAGEVVAVNMAILPEYGGSNLGVPAAALRALLDAPG